MKDGTHPSPFAALSFPDSEKVPFIAGWTEFSSRRIAKQGHNLTIFRQLSAPKPGVSNHSTNSFSPDTVDSCYLEVEGTR